MGLITVVYHTVAEIDWSGFRRKLDVSHRKLPRCFWRLSRNTSRKSSLGDQASDMPQGDNKMHSSRTCITTTEHCLEQPGAAESNQKSFWTSTLGKQNGHSCKEEQQNEDLHRSTSIEWSTGQRTPHSAGIWTGKGKSFLKAWTCEKACGNIFSMKNQA